MAEKEIKLSELIKPTDRQREFFAAMDAFKFTLYGGAKGGGKSYIIRWAVVRKLLQYAQRGFKGVRGVIFCEDYPTLKDRQVSKMSTEFPEWLGKLGSSQTEGLSFKAHKKYGGWTIALRNLDDPSKYASSEFAVVAIDELTKNHKEKFDQIRSIMRWPGIEDTRFIAGTNPGDIGHAWVKKLFIDRDFGPEDPLPDQVTFVKSLPTDNPHNAKSYLEELQRLPEKLRKAYWDGNWDVFEGQFFTEWDKEQHVVSPFAIPDTWVKWRSIDVSGRNGITSCHWYALDHDGVVWCYREHYKTGMDSDEHALEIARLSGIEQYAYTVIDSAAFSKLGLAETQAEVYERNGVTGLVAASKDRVNGWDIVHQHLRWTPVQKPRVRFFSTCYNMIRTIPLAIHDELNPDDIDTEGEDHALDDLRYALQTVRAQKVPETEKKKEIAQTGPNYVMQRLAAIKAKKRGSGVPTQQDYI